MKNMLALAALAGFMSLGSISAQAAPNVTSWSHADAVASNIELVAEGCGPGGFRDRFGRCIARRPVYRRCPPGLHPTPRGCRPNY